MLTGSISDSFLFITPIVLFFYLILITFFKINLTSNIKNIYIDKINPISNINNLFYLCFILLTNFLFIFLINYMFLFKN